MKCVRVEKNRDYTVISNVFLRDNRLSLKAKGMLSMLMSLDKDWDFTIKGFIQLTKEGESSVYNTIRELKELGYCVEKKKRGDNQCFMGSEYVFYESPFSQVTDNQPRRENPDVENPDVENPDVENQGQLNTNNNKILNKRNKENIKRKETDTYFETCWEAYHRKGSKKQARYQWEKLTNEEKQSVMPHIKAYVSSREITFQKDFERYLRDRIFEDVIYSKSGQMVFDPQKGDSNAYMPQQSPTLKWNDYYKCYMYIGFWDGHIADGYSDDERPDGASVTLNNGRGTIVWNKGQKQWIKE